MMNCRFSIYVPSSSEHLPSPLVWEPCTSTQEQITYECRQIKRDWPALTPAPYGLAGDISAYVDTDGRVILLLRKVYYPTLADIGIMTLVVEADGPVRQAFWSGIMSRSEENRMLGSGTIAPGKSAIAFYALSGFQPYRIEWIVGDDALLRPPTIFDRPVEDPMTGEVYSGSHHYVIKGNQFGVYRWDGTYMGAVDSDAPAFGDVQWVGRTMLYALASNPWFRIMRWTEHDGARVLVDLGDDYTRGAGYPGSDGKDLVWLQAEDG